MPKTDLVVTNFLRTLSESVAKLDLAEVSDFLLNLATHLSDRVASIKQVQAEPGVPSGYVGKFSAELEDMVKHLCRARNACVLASLFMVKPTVNDQQECKHSNTFMVPPGGYIRVCLDCEQTDEIGSGWGPLGFESDRERQEWHEYVACLRTLKERLAQCKVSVEDQ